MKSKLVVFITMMISQKFAISEHFSTKDIQIYFLEKKVSEMAEKAAYLERYKDTLDQVKELSEFFWKLGKFESGNNYDTVNTLGYLGKYQFGLQTLRTLGFECSPEEFLRNPMLQEYAIIKLNIMNNKILQKRLDYDSIRYDYLAAAHLAGPGNVIKYVKEGYNPSDRYGTSVQDYINKFEKVR